jgi:hypothetical protein
MPSLLADNGSGHGFLATEGPFDALAGTRDGGRHWHTVARDGGSFFGWADLRFVNADTGFVVGPTHYSPAGGRRRCCCCRLGVGALVPVGDDPELDDPRGPGNHYQQHAEHGGEQERDSQRQVPVHAEVADGNPLPVFQDEDQQQQQYQGKQRGGHPHAADPGPPDHMLAR